MGQSIPWGGFLEQKKVVKQRISSQIILSQMHAVVGDDLHF